MQESQISFGQLLKYCLSYIKILNPALARHKTSTEVLTESVLSGDFLYQPINDAVMSRVLVNLEEFYSLLPSDLTDENRKSYNEQKKIADQLEDIITKFRVNEYTKQITLNFGFLHIELPDADEGDNKSIKTLKEWNPLFQLPINIIPVTDADNVKRYYLELLEVDILPNAGFLQAVLEDEHYGRLAQHINELEVNGELKLPLSKEVLEKLWVEIKRYLKLSDAIFDEDSFDLSRFTVELAAKSNFFLIQDLTELGEMADEELLETSLSSWVSDVDMSIQEDVDEDKQEVFFPFDYNKYQVRTLGIINNRASIVQGPPGTGKSQTIANILCHLAASGQRVLFLSQKDQAIRGVKDSLKQLDIPYLYGYVPNRQSVLYTPQDERDGAAYALMSIEHHLTSIEDERPDPLPKRFKFSAYSSLFDDAVEVQRRYFELREQISALDEFNPPKEDPGKFIVNFDKQSMNDLLEQKANKDQLTDKIHKYAQHSANLSELGEQFQAVSFNKSFHSIFDSIIKVIEEDGYDRSNRFNRALKNTLLKRKLKRETDQLPRELYSQFDNAISKDQSKAEAAQELRTIRDYCLYRETQIKVEALEESIKEAQSRLGLDDADFAAYASLVHKYGIDTVCERINKLNQLISEANDLEILNPNAVKQTIYKSQETRKDRVRLYIRNRLNRRLKDTVSTRTIRGVITRISKALQKSKRAFKTFDQFKNNPENFQVLREVVPIWMMDLEDVSRLIPLDKNLFDYVIIDEASQCNIAYALPAMFRTKHIMLFGDTEQMRPSVNFKTNQLMDDLAAKFKIPTHLQIKGSGEAIKSVMDIGLMTGFMSRTLLYHYRSPKELIGFSNENFYAPKKKRMEVINSNYLTFEDTRRVLVPHFIEPDPSEEEGEKTNYSEAKYIKNLIDTLKKDDTTKDKSIAVLAFFNEQAELLRKVIDDDSIKVSIIDGIQGDERDIVIYSFVITSASEKPRYVPLTAEGGEVNQELNAGRVNVAFSRARQQVHAVTSMPIENWPEGIWIRKYLEYVRDHGAIRFYDSELKKCDSQFEVDFLNLLQSSLDDRFIIQNQVESCGFKLDFVVTDRHTQRKLAIECDGPCHFESGDPESRVDRDFEREDILVSAGWSIYHVLYSDWLDNDINKQDFIRDIHQYFNVGEIAHNGDVPEIIIEDEREVSTEVAESPVDQAVTDTAAEPDPSPEPEESLLPSRRKNELGQQVLQDRKPVTPIARIKPGDVKIKAHVGRVSAIGTSRSYLTRYEAVLSDESGSILAVWFNKAYLTHYFDSKKEYLFVGTAAFKYGKLSLQSPRFTDAEPAVVE